MAIYESGQYKEDLRREVRGIRRLLHVADIENLESYSFKLEKFLFVSAYIIRKLIEAKKISDELEKDIYKFESADALDYDAICDFLSKQNFVKNYEINKRKKAGFKVGELVNIFIHSYVFCLSLNYRGLSKVEKNDVINLFELIITSDYRKKHIYFIRLGAYLDICDKVCADEIRHMEIGVMNGQQYRSLLKKSRYNSKKSIAKRVKI